MGEITHEITHRKGIASREKVVSYLLGKGRKRGILGNNGIKRESEESGEKVRVSEYAVV